MCLRTSRPTVLLERGEEELRDIGDRMTEQIEQRRRERYVRWQEIRRDQLGYAINLFLAFSTASLGFALSLLNDPKFPGSCWQRAFFSTSLFVFVFSIVDGVACVLNRLCDFRKTANRVRHGGDEQDRAEIRRLEKRTSRLLYLQVGSDIWRVQPCPVG